MTATIQSHPATPLASSRSLLKTTLSLTALRCWWQRLWLDEQTRYFEQASDIADLERRMRAWDDALQGARQPLW